MSRLPPPDPGWDESTEGDLDEDLTEEAGSRLDDWDAPQAPWWRRGALPAIALGMIAMLVGALLAQAFLGR